MLFCINITYLCTMLQGWKYRLYPNKAQAELINKHIGACRFVYNLALETKNYAYASHRKNISCFDLMNQLPELKRECIWLKEIDSQALQQSVINLDKAVIDREHKGEIKSSTISRSPTGKYYVSILTDNHKAFPKKKPIKESTAVGIDLGLHHFIVTSDGA